MRIAFALLAACSSSSPMMPSEIPDAPVSSDGSPEPSAACASKQAQPLDASWTVTVGTLQRTTKVHVPASYDPTRPTPLVINLHGRTGNADSQILVSHANTKSNAA